MRIVSVQVDHFRLPLATPLSDSTHHEISKFELITVRIICDGGEEGLGYTYTVGSGGAAIRTLIERDIAKILLKSDPGRIEEIWERMWWTLHWVGRGGLAALAISAVDIALWDLKGRSTGEPLWKLLGGHSREVRAYAGGVDLQFTVEALREQAGKFLERGFRAVKMKVGRPMLSEDLSRVAAIREMLEPDIPLMVDANMGWTVDQAIRASRALADLDVYWLEEPTIPEDVDGHIAIAREGRLPIAAGENFRSLYEFRDLITRGGVSFPEPDVSNIGGITVWMKVAHLAEASNLPVTSHGVHDLHVHLLAAVPNASFLEVHGFGLEPYINHSLEMVDGIAIAPDRPGHGVEFDWEALEPHQDRG